MNAITIDGTAERDRFGTSLANLGDIDDDGYEGAVTYLVSFFLYDIVLLTYYFVLLWYRLCSWSPI